MRNSKKPKNIITPPWQHPDTAPRDGTGFIADIGWPCAVTAMWDEHGQQWCYAAPQACPMEDGTRNWYFESQSGSEMALRAWTPLPALPAGHGAHQARS